MHEETLTPEQFMDRLKQNQKLRHLQFELEGGVIKIRDFTGSRRATVTPIRDKWDGYVIQVSPSGNIIYDEGFCSEPKIITILLEVFFSRIL